MDLRVLASAPYSQVHYVISLAFLGDLQTYKILETVLYSNQKTNVLKIKIHFHNGRRKTGCFTISQHLGDLEPCF